MAISPGTRCEAGSGCPPSGQYAVALRATREELPGGKALGKQHRRDPRPPVSQDSSRAMRKVCRSEGREPGAQGVSVDRDALRAP